MMKIILGYSLSSAQVILSVNILLGSICFAPDPRDGIAEDPDPQKHFYSGTGTQTNAETKPGIEDHGLEQFSEELSQLTQPRKDGDLKFPAENLYKLIDEVVEMEDLDPELQDDMINTIEQLLDMEQTSLYREEEEEEDHLVEPVIDTPILEPPHLEPDLSEIEKPNPELPVPETPTLPETPIPKPPSVAETPVSEPPTIPETREMVDKSKIDSGSDSEKKKINGAQSLIQISFWCQLLPLCLVVVFWK